MKASMRIDIFAKMLLTSSMSARDSKMRLTIPRSAFASTHEVSLSNDLV